MFILLYLMWYDTLSKHFSHSQFNCVDTKKLWSSTNSLLQKFHKNCLVFYFISLFLYSTSNLDEFSCDKLLALCVCFSFVTKEDSLVTAFVVYKSNEIKTRHWISTRGIYDGKMSKIIEAAKQIFLFHKIKRFFLSS